MQDILADAAGPGPVVSALVPGGFRIEDRLYPAVLLTPDRAIAWEPPALAGLGEGDLRPLLDGEHPYEFLLIGTGPSLVRPPRALVRGLDARGIGVEAMDSRAAARAWGVLRAEDRWIGAALFPHR